MSTTIRDLPAATDRWEQILTELRGGSPALFLDFDGTLAPIVADPARARLPERTRGAIERLLRRCPVTVMSGRDADDVRTRVAIDGVIYAGSHGFDVIWPDGRREQRGLEYQDSLRAAQVQLTQEIASIPGAELEPKRFAVAVHHRRVPPGRVEDVLRAVDRVADRFGDLRRTGGKQVLELRPDLDWDKGRALQWLLDEFDRGDRVVPVYLGDDLTDEDAFATIREGGTGVALVVRGEDDRRRTEGDYTVADVDQVAVLLERLADHLDEGA